MLSPKDEIQQGCMIELLYSTTHIQYHSQAMEKEQARRCCTPDVCLRKSVNQLYNNQKMAMLFPLLDHSTYM